MAAWRGAAEGEPSEHGNAVETTVHVPNADGPYQAANVLNA